jgi:hypothetical protein
MSPDCKGLRAYPSNTFFEPSSGSVPIDVVFCSSPIVRFLTDARLKQASPAETTFQPLSHHSVALNVCT